MGIQISSQSTSLFNRLVTRVPVGSSQEGVHQKFFGEPLPPLADIRNNAFLQSIFSQLGVLGRLQRKLAYHSRKKGRIVPAKNTIACALSACEETDNEDWVFVGVDFAAEHHQDEDLLAGVLGHEWGHLISDYPVGLNPNEMTWEEIFALRKEEEAGADAFAGKMLFEMNYQPEALIRFLAQHTKNPHGSHKYESVATRAAIIQGAYNNSRRKRSQVQNLATLIPALRSSPYMSRIIAVA